MSRFDGRFSRSKQRKRPYDGTLFIWCVLLKIGGFKLWTSGNPNKKTCEVPSPPLLFCQRKQRNFGLENFYLSIFPQQYWMSQLVFNDVNFITSSSRKKRLSINIFHHIYINIITTSIPSILVNKEYVYMKIRFSLSM